MIETYDNSFQILVLLVCGTIAVWRAIKYDSRSWTLLGLFYGSWMLGDIYWVLCLIFYGENPEVTLIADFSWHAAYLFIYLLLTRLSPLKKDRKKSWIPWLGPLFATGMTVYFMMDGSILSNLVTGFLMALLLLAALERLVDRKSHEKVYYIALLIVIFCLLEYALWLIPWSRMGGDSLLNPYYYVDVLLSISITFFVPALRKAVMA